MHHHQTHKKHPPHQTVTSTGSRTFSLLLGSSQVSTCEVPIVFPMTTFSYQMVAFFTAWTYPKAHQTWNIYVTLAKNFHNLLSYSNSTTRWRYNQGKCALAYNSHILCHTFKNLIITCSPNSAESHDIGHFLPFFSAKWPNVANLLFHPHLNCWCSPFWCFIIKLPWIHLRCTPRRAWTARAHSLLLGAIIFQNSDFKSQAKFWL